MGSLHGLFFFLGWGGVGGTGECFYLIFGVTPPCLHMKLVFERCEPNVTNSLSSGERVIPNTVWTS